MTRKDITNINNLLLEAKHTRYYMYCPDITYDGNATAIAVGISIDIKKVSYKLLRKTLPAYVDDIYDLDVDDTIHFKCQEAAVVLDNGQMLYFITPYKTKSSGNITQFIANILESAPGIPISKFITDTEYKQKALRGSNDEAGLGDMLDVL